MLTSLEQEWIGALPEEDRVYLENQMKLAGITEEDVALIEQASVGAELQRLANLEKVASDSGIDLNALDAEELQEVLHLQQMFDEDPDLAESILQQLQEGGAGTEGASSEATSADTATASGETESATEGDSGGTEQELDMSDPEFVAKAASLLGQEKTAALLHEGAVLAYGFYSGMAKMAAQVADDESLYAEGEKLGMALFDSDVKEAEERRSAIDRLVVKMAQFKKTAMEGEGGGEGGGEEKDMEKKKEEEKKKSPLENLRASLAARSEK